jgi:hypothetical protein
MAEGVSRVQDVFSQIEASLSNYLETIGARISRNSDATAENEQAPDA